MVGIELLQLQGRDVVGLMLRQRAAGIIHLGGNDPGFAPVCVLLQLAQPANRSRLIAEERYAPVRVGRQTHLAVLLPGQLAIATRDLKNFHANTEVKKLRPPWPKLYQKISA